MIEIVWGSELKSLGSYFVYIMLRIFIQDSLFSSQGELLSTRVPSKRS